MFPFGVPFGGGSLSIYNKLKVFLEPVEPVENTNGIHLSANISLLHRLGDESRIVMKGTNFRMRCRCVNCTLLTIMGDS